MSIINKYKVRDGVTAADIKEELKQKHLPISVGNCSYIHKDGVFVTFKTLIYDISVNICFPKNLSEWNSYDYVIVLDNWGGQPYTPFYDLEERSKKFPNKPRIYAHDVAEHYNQFMDSLNFLERMDLETETQLNTKKKNALFGRYPSCDMLNNALRFIHEGKIDIACQEIVFAIEKANGYFHEDLIPLVEQIKTDWVKTHSW